VRQEQNGTGDDERLLMLVADLLPVLGVAEDAGVRFEAALVGDRRKLARFGCLSRWLSGCAGRVTVLGGRNILERALGDGDGVGIDHAEDVLGPELAAKQPHRLHVRVHVVAGAGEEAGHIDALEGRDVQLGRNRRFNGDFGVTAATTAGERADDDQAKAGDRLSESHGH
jgi:hypothetical protein